MRKGYKERKNFTDTGWENKERKNETSVIGQQPVLFFIIEGFCAKRGYIAVRADFFFAGLS